ncbi:sugar ABC transporter ATP-binding protein [Rubellimicrobium aerolatum]|uniref:Sugar ABC transporter ATP-binding protein n=1 Tax=Rubellimicrobium aerolatum TaxID=490979 RepID=A0ABW0SDC6_9RHOB|nr:sugar ABC transporter ATP-binding protein [Rubellimicrobium aerolatum]MBP1806670.1 ABC-type sugar transport system ATPase subunit [Rubellimicrobium aerolatum]
MTQPIVEMRDITKTFGSTRALRGVDFTVMPGEIHALLGRNGAGKSTLVSALSGVTPADAGTIRIGGTSVTANGQSYAAAIRDEIAHVQQTPRLFDQLTVAENLFLENPVVRKRYGLVSHGRMISRTQALLDEWRIDIRPTALAGQLDAGTRQLLEIMKALNRGVPVMILDEPTAALSNAEKRILFDHIRALKLRGVSFVYISHHLDEVFEVADTVTILRDGQIVTARAPVSSLDVETIANLMMGQATTRSERSDTTDATAPPLLRAKGIRIGPAHEATVDLEVRGGEIVALAGPVGSGKESLAMILAGHQTPFGGEISSPRGKLPVIGLVPTDRHASGYVGILGVRENVAAGGLDILSGPLGFINRRKEQEHVGRLARQTNVIASSLDQAVGQLSGGNQQKVVFARSLCRSPDVIVALSPTRGVDVGAKEQLYALLRDLAAKGMGVVVVSDEEDEISQLANRVVIVFEGAIVDELVGDYSMKDLILRMEGVA